MKEVPQTIPKDRRWKLNVQAAMLERLRKVLGNEAELIFDKTGESGRISLWFENHDRLNEMVDLICSLRQ